MRYVSLLAVLACLTISFGCTRKLAGNGNFINEERHPGNFSRLESDGAFNIVLTADSGDAVQVLAESNILPEIVTEVQGSALIIGYKNDVTDLQHGDVLVKVPSRGLKSVSLAGSGNIVSQDTMRADNFEAALLGSGKVELWVAGTYLTTDLSGSGDVLLKGRVNSSKINIAGAGKIHAYDLPCSISKIDIAGSGDAEVNVAQILEVNISGSGTVRYTGTPAVTSTITGSGKVKQR